MELNKITEKLAISIGHLCVSYLELDNCHKSMQITTKLRERKDHFEVTIYKKDRQNLDISIGDIVVLRLGNHELIRPVKKDFHISLPKGISRDKTNGDKFTLFISKITKTADCLTRPKNPFQSDKLDIRYFVPKKTIFARPIYIIEREGNYSSIWYPVGGGVKHLTIKNTADINKISELIGFYFGDGATSRDIRSFRLTNCEPSVLNYCLNTLEEISIHRNSFKIQIIYSTDKNMTEEIKTKCINFWSDALRINKDNIVSVNKARNIRETLDYGSARIFIDSAILVEVFLHGLLKGILPIITSPKGESDKRLLGGFMRGLLAAEGGVNLNKHGSVVKIGISYDPHSGELDLYKKLLQNLDINFAGTKGNELYICGYKNINTLYELNAFKMHQKRNQKFIRGFKHHKFSNPKQSF